MTVQEMQQSDWYKLKPKVIQQVLVAIPPIQLYKFKSSGYQCYIVSYEEPESGRYEDATVTVQKTGSGGILDNDLLALSKINTNKVFGVKPEDLEAWDRKYDIP